MVEKIIIVGCQTLQNELERAMEITGCNYEVRWVESGLHNYPQKLNHVLQEILNDCNDASVVLMAMGYCGNSVAGLTSGDFTLILPRVDDCITLLLGSQHNRITASGGMDTYFLTDGWLKGERNILREYEYAIEKYGEKRGNRIFRAMIGHYKTLALLDTGCFSMDHAGRESKKIAHTLNLQYKEIPGTLELLKQLLRQEWDEERFLIIPPHGVIQREELLRFC